MSRYTSAARRITSTRQPARAKPEPAGDRPDRAQVRDWARTHGMEVKDRGRIPAELIVRFQAATGQ
jgi:hypothetical protein